MVADYTDVSEAARELGRRGGRSKSAAKVEAGRRNAAKARADKARKGVPL